MPHCEDEALSLVALGDRPSREDEAHLAACTRCSSRLDQLAAVVASAPSLTDADQPVAPPAHVWDGIQRELRTDPATVRSIDSARSGRQRVWLVAAAAAVPGAVAGGVLTSSLSSTTAPADIVARASLAPIEDSGYAGEATVERTDTGSSLTVTVPGLPQVEDGYYEVWMATADTATMVAIGTLGSGESVTFALPSGMDVAQFPVVDVSVEHFDGDAGHSATSVVPGQLVT